MACAGETPTIETLAAVKRFARRTFEDHSINGVSRVQSAIVDNTSSPIMIKTPYKYKIVSTDGSSIPTDYLVMHAYDFTSLNAPANSVVPFGNIHYQYSYRTFNEICNNSDSYYTRLHIPATLPDGIAFKFWHEGEEEPMLDWELEQSTTDPGPASESTSASTSESTSESVSESTSESTSASTSESTSASASESCSE